MLEYLGIILYTVNMQARLPEENIVRITDFIQTILNKRSCTRKELEQLLGHFNFEVVLLSLIYTGLCHLLRKLTITYI